MIQGTALTSPALTASPPLRVTHLITASGIGGAEKMLFELVTRLPKERFQCRVISLKPLGHTAERLLAAGIPVSSLELPARIGPRYLLQLPFAFFRLRRLLAENPPQVLHCWLFQANLLGRLAAWRQSFPNLSSLRVIEEERIFQYPLDRLTRHLVTLYVANSTAVAEHYRKRLGLAPSRIRVIPNGIEIAESGSQKRQAFRHEMRISEEALVIGALGRLHRQKGLDILLEAMPQVLARFPRTYLLIAGEGPERVRLERRAREISPQIFFLGEWLRPAEFLAGLDLLVLPSRWEGMPNVALEAMAEAKAVVATAVGGTPELVVSGHELAPMPGETGLLVPPENVQALARAIVCLLADESRRTAMGQAGLARAKAEFSVQKMVDLYAELYESLGRGNSP